MDIVTAFQNHGLTAAFHKSTKKPEYEIVGLLCVLGGILAARTGSQSELEFDHFEGQIIGFDPWKIGAASFHKAGPRVGPISPDATLALEAECLKRGLKQPPELDKMCGRHLTYRDLIHCGETWREISTNKLLRVENLPASEDTYLAMERLCTKVLDPVIDQFGMIVLSYGYSSEPLLTCIRKFRKKKANTSSTHDQHRGCDLDSKGRRVCRYGGFAVDLIVPGRRSGEVMEWVRKSTDYDKIFFYGDDLPFHVSYKPDGRKELLDKSTYWNGERT